MFTERFWAWFQELIYLRQNRNLTLWPLCTFTTKLFICHFKTEYSQYVIQKRPDYSRCFDRNTHGDSNWKIISCLQNLWGLKGKNPTCVYCLHLCFVHKFSQSQILWPVFTAVRVPLGSLVTFHLLYIKSWKLNCVWLVNLPPGHLHMHCWLCWWSSVSLSYRRSTTENHRTWAK